jgi:hypothetical protein
VSGDRLATVVECRAWAERNATRLNTRHKLAQWLFLVSGVVHAALYPLSAICIVIGFWTQGFKRGLAIMLYFAVAVVLFRFLIAGAFALLIGLLDPSFFDR